MKILIITNHRINKTDRTPSGSDYGLEADIRRQIENNGFLIFDNRFVYSVAEFDDICATDTDKRAVMIYDLVKDSCFDEDGTRVIYEDRITEAVGTAGLTILKENNLIEELSILNGYKKYKLQELS